MSPRVGIRGWRGLDNSGPKDVITAPELPGDTEGKTVDINGTAIAPSDSKGKGKAKAE